MKRFWLPLTPEQKWFETGFNVNIVYGNLKSENPQDYAQKSQQYRTLMNSASGLVLRPSIAIYITTIGLPILLQ